jgi:hypothetical protein
VDEEKPDVDFGVAEGVWLESPVEDVIPTLEASVPKSRVSRPTSGGFVLHLGLLAPQSLSTYLISESIHRSILMNHLP